MPFYITLLSFKTSLYFELFFFVFYDCFCFLFLLNTCARFQAYCACLSRGLLQALSAGHLSTRCWQLALPALHWSWVTRLTLSCSCSFPFQDSLASGLQASVRSHTYLPQLWEVAEPKLLQAFLPRATLRGTAGPLLATSPGAALEMKWGGGGY